MVVINQELACLQVHPNPYRPSYLRLKVYEFAGRLVGKCLYESSLGGAYKQLVRARFTRSFLAQIIGLRMHYKVASTLIFALLLCVCTVENTVVTKDHVLLFLSVF